jgi:hypothetical protein
VETRPLYAVSLETFSIIELRLARFDNTLCGSLDGPYF